MAHELRDGDDDQSRHDPGPNESVAIAFRCDEVNDDRNEERGSTAVAGGDHPRSETAPVAEPLEDRPNATAVHQSGAGAGDGVGGVELRQRLNESDRGPA